MTHWPLRVSISRSAQLLAVLQLVRSGCEAALAEKRAWGTLDDESQRRDRWVTPGLIDKVHAAVAKTQGVAPWEADGAQRGPLQPELTACFGAIESFLDIDLPTCAPRAARFPARSPNPVHAHQHTSHVSHVLTAIAQHRCMHVAEATRCLSAPPTAANCVSARLSSPQSVGATRQGAADLRRGGGRRMGWRAGTRRPRAGP